MKTSKHKSKQNKNKPTHKQTKKSEGDMKAIIMEGTKYCREVYYLISLKKCSFMYLMYLISYIACYS